MRRADAGILISRTITLTGLVTLVLAPVWCVCPESERHYCCHLHGARSSPHPARRYTAAASCGLLYLLIGSFRCHHHRIAVGVSPRAGGGNRWPGAAGYDCQRASVLALEQVAHREAAIITFLVTLGGVVIAGVARLLGVVAGGWRCSLQYCGRATQLQSVPSAAAAMPPLPPQGGGWSAR